jgi:hypothetical protein
MFALPIWGSDPAQAEMRAALAAGWRRCDLRWERLQEAANHHWRSGSRGRAVAGFLASMALARGFFPRSDPRYATSLANFAFAMRALGLDRFAARLHERSMALWSDAGRALDGANIRPRARSSLFHLRMEARHWETYKATRKARLAAFIDETGRALPAIARGEAPPVRLFSRWLGEKPPVFDDGRKIIAACLLVASEER